MTLTEAELRRFIAGPYASFLRILTLTTGSRAAAEDAVHESLARACERGDIKDLNRWVLTVALNVGRSRWRKVRHETPLTDSAEPGVDAHPLDVDLLRALRRLPRRQREVTVLHYLVDLPITEVAAIVGLSEGGVKNALFRARRSLAAALLPDHTEEVTS
ncbi:MAG TPA: sigma-70 family RNA polymerase sigma factor [Acidimicrobiales bacterium]|nr:sigma-70 family RNA polymerase sigma factor [Acidimicrobiales bacterium]